MSIDNTAHADVLLPIKIAAAIEFSYDELIDLVTGFILATGYRAYGRRTLDRALSQYILTVGSAHLDWWRDIDDHQSIACAHDQAVGLVIHAYYRVFFPNAESPAGYMERLADWRAHLDPAELSRYTSGKINAFGH